MAHQFEVTQADKSFLRCAIPWKGSPSLSTWWRATAAGARLAVPSGKKGLSQAKQLTTLAMPARSRKPRHPAPNDRLRGVGAKGEAERKDTCAEHS